MKLKLLVSVLMVFSVMFFAGCSKDDDDKKNNTGGQSGSGSIVGTWTYAGIEVYEFTADGKWYNLPKEEDDFIWYELEGESIKVSTTDSKEGPYVVQTAVIFKNGKVVASGIELSKK